MALTPAEEVQVRELLAEEAELLSLAANETAILSKLAATKVNLSSLAAASSGNASDLLLTRQGVNDKSITLDLLTQFVLGNGVTPPQFDNDTSIATSAFVQRALGNAQGITVSTGALVLTAADAGKVFDCTAPSAPVLPALSAVPDGAQYHIFVAGTSTAVTVTANGADTITKGFGTDAGTLAVPVGTFVTFTASAGTKWHATGTGVGTFLKSTDGYMRMPNGIIVQWGVSSAIVSGANGNVTFPITFPTACWTAYSTFVQSTDVAVGGAYIGLIRTVAAGNIAIRNLGPASAQYNWLAIGH